VAWAAKLGPWGNVLQEYNPQGIHQAIRLPGQHHDRETGLFYNQHRYYDPVVWISTNQDPTGLVGGVKKVYMR
jgi:RHS repeat-associated protein